MKFDPNATGTADAGIFALPFTEKESRLVLLPVPWEVTTSYGDGTSLGPDSIYECSRQIDLYHADAGDSYEKGIFWRDDKASTWKKLNDELKPMAKGITAALESGDKLGAEHSRAQETINMKGAAFHEEVYQECKSILNSGKLLGLVGGDHSCPYGSIRAVTEHHKGDVTIIHIDAHADLRNSYQGYKHSHASIMRNVMLDFKPRQLVQLGIRDFCQEEADFIKANSNIKTFFDRDVKRRMAGGESWHSVCKDVLKHVPTEKIYFSFDIDGLNPALCPNTGTPVPGGLDYDHVLELMHFVVSQGKKIVGFDLNEVAPPSAEELDCWDGNVGARVLYNLCCYTLVSDQK